MKKYLIILLAVTLSFSSTINLQAYQKEGASQLHVYEHFQVGSFNVWDGVTEDGVKFTVFKPSKSSNIANRQISDSMFIDRFVSFEGHITPQTTIPWTEFMHGRTWGGNLRLADTGRHNNPNTTWALYAGTVWAVN
ncbi:MAG: hypothetical protein FWE02_05690 [Defluviitaleaceae bacterium]|nr:hypothetical protein [Defluviitaleaceae bacterium]